jgi:hypothetical protein
MDIQERSTPRKASKLFAQCEILIRELAEKKYFGGLSIINSDIRKLRPEYFDYTIARKVAAAVQLLEIIHGRSAKWNKEERKRLLNNATKPV